MRMTAEELPDALITDSASREAFADAPAEADATGATEATLEEAVDAACALVPPIWPLRHFVAVNAYLGWSDRPLFEAAEEIDRLYHADALMPLDFYRRQWATGRITATDLAAAMRDAPAALGRPDLVGADVVALRDALAGDAEPPGADPERVLTLAEAVDRQEGSAWSELVIDEIAKWCAARFDAGQNAWRQPWQELPPWAAWREAARVDRSPEVHGLTGFRAYASALPENPMEAIAAVLRQLDVPPARYRSFLARALAQIAGWAGHVQYRVREAALTGRATDVSLRDLLAIRLAFDGALDRSLGGRSALLRAEPLAPARRRRIASRDLETRPVPDRLALSAPEVRLLGQLAYEAGHRRQLLARLAAPPRGPSPQGTARVRLQAVFCIDVRSEVLRRHLEALSPDVRTIGFAGFFGVPFEYVRTGDTRGSARCPVLIAPPHRLREAAPEGSDAGGRTLRARERHRLFTAMRKLTVGAFPLVETVGHFFGLRLVSDSLGWTRPHEGGALFPTRSRNALRPALEPDRRDGGFSGLGLTEQVDLAEGALRNMGLTRDFAKIVLLCGHGSRSTNNPYASALDCGACGGHPGDVNARVAVALLESPSVRAGLAARGIAVPDDTRFVAGLHDTSTDEVTLLDAEALPADARREIEHWLAEAGARARAERAPALGERPGKGLADRLRKRAGDWSEVRPEWGLAGNAAFVAAPRARTRGVDLGGRVFLHDYDAAMDPEGEVLRLVLTAPMVVASWINLQYYASTVDNAVFGSGDKTLHNVVGRHGVMLGNRSDLRPGLPWQSIHDGRRYVHEPMRLVAIVEAPRERIAAILDAHPDVRELVDNEWIALVAWDADTGAFHRWRRAGHWEEMEPGEEVQAAAGL